MNSSIALGVILVLIAAVEIGVAYQLRELKERVGGGITLGAIVAFIFGARLLIQQTQIDKWLVLIVLASQAIAVATLVKIIRDRAERDDDDQPHQAAPYGAPTHASQQFPAQPSAQPGAQSGNQGAYRPPPPPPSYGGPPQPPQQR